MFFSFVRLLSGNQLTGSLPQELGSLSNLLILQIDYNEISGKLPTSLANLKKLKHLWDLLLSYVSYLFLTQTLLT